ncbi:hypothetical protein [uncultured Polaribacter sp.]|uniref:hypothetical protein n=1 Tax=uncultured Polaribacter sp. TaxID=174711 RepID=UPI003704A1C7
MRVNYFFIFIVFLTFNITAQELYVSLGRNITSFDYKSTNGSDKNLEFRSGYGNNFEAGFLTHRFNKYKILYSIGFVYNEFNAEASSNGINYSWETKYLGILNKISFHFSDFFYRTELKTFLILGFSTSTLVGGEQFINNKYYDLTKNEDFLGVNLQPFVGINSQYTVAKNLKVTMGYNFSKTFNLFNKSEENISFNTHQLQIGLLMSVYR